MSTEQKMLDCAKLATQGEWEAEGLYVSEAGEGGSVIASSGMGFPAEQCRANNAHIAASSPANVIARIESKRALEAALKAVVGMNEQSRMDREDGWPETLGGWHIRMEGLATIAAKALKENQ